MVADSIMNSSHLGSYKCSNAPNVAVLMATYAGDTSAHLKAALDSLFSQSYPCEKVRIYLVIDGPIPDENAQVIENAKVAHDSRALHVVTLVANIGLAEALNTAAKEFGNEDFIVRADADDLSEPTRVEEQVRYMNAHPQVDILGTSILEFSEPNNVLGKRTYPRSNAVRDYISYASPLAHPSVCFRRSAWERLGGYRPIPFNEDLDMWFRAVQSGICIDNLAQPLVRFRISHGFYRRRSWAKAFAEFRCYVRGILAVHGITWRLVLPVARLLTRLMPPTFTRFIYARSALRRRILNRGPV